MMRQHGSSFDVNSIVLGTALWGWKVSKASAFSLLDYYTEFGGRLIDTAANYPINKASKDMGLASQWLGEWLSMNPSADLDVWYKFGAVDNLGSSHVDLSYSNLTKALSEANELLQEKIRVVGVHWDNRSCVDIEAASETLKFFKEQSDLGYQVALSGIKSPDLYLQLWPENTKNWLIQVKDNALTSDARVHYSKCFPEAKYYAYGINMGGVKSSAPPAPGSSMALRGISPQGIAKKIESFINQEDIMHPMPKSFNDFALMRAFLIPQINGVVLGPSNVQQLKQSLAFWQSLSLGVSDNVGDLLVNLCSLD